MIIPAVLENTFEKTLEKINLFSKFAEVIQIDFVDNTLFRGKTFLEYKKLNDIKTDLSYDLHLLVENPMPYLNTKIEKAKSICMQIEAKEYVSEFIKRSKELGYKVGLSLAPQTPIDKVEKYIDKLDYVQFMGIEPGAQGRPFNYQVIVNVANFRKKHPRILIQVDGGLNESNISVLKSAGADNFIVGSTIIKASNPEEKFIQLNNRMNEVSTIAQEKSKMKIEKIAILGGAAWQETDQPYIDAFNTCKLLAENGYEIVNGGGPGVMRAATKGAHAGGGRALAITYHPNKPKRHYEGVDLLNDFDDEVTTLDYFDRTKVMLITTQMHVVFKGSIGTLSEFGMTWISSWIHEPNSKPIALFGNFWDEIIATLRKDMLLEKHEEGMLKICNSPEEVLEYAKSFE